MEINELYVSFERRPQLRSKIAATSAENWPLYRAAEQFDRTTLGYSGFVYRPSRLIQFLAGCLCIGARVGAISQEDQMLFVAACMQSAIYQQADVESRTIAPVVISQATKDEFLKRVTELVVMSFASAA